MTKLKKTALIVLLSILTILVILNSIVLAFMWKRVDNQTEPIFINSDKLVKIDDVGYIRYDVVRPDPAKVESGEFRTYDREEITALIDDAIAKRDEKNKANSTAN